jgi:hypothetical protein
MFNEIKNKFNSNNITIENYVLDYRLSKDKLNSLIKEINPKNRLDNKITNKYQEINVILKEDSNANDNIISYDNCYLLSNHSKGILDTLINYSQLNLDFSKEQLRYNITLDNKKNNIKTNNKNNINIYNNDEPAPIEQLEDILGKYLEMNDMEITEYLNKENCIEIAIFNKLKKTYTDIKINNYYQDNNIKILINNDNDNDDLMENVKEDKKHKSKSKSKSKKKNKSKDKETKMEIEEEENNNSNNNNNDINEINNEIIDEDKLPSIEINSEDAEDSIFLNTLFNSIFV